MLVGRNQLPGAVILKQLPVHGTAVSCMSGLFYSTIPAVSGVWSPEFLWRKTGTREVQRMGCRNGLKPRGLQDTHEAVCIRNGEVIRGAETLLADGTR